MKAKKLLTVVLAALLLFCMIPASAFAEVQSVKLSRYGGYNAVQGDTVYIDITAVSSSADGYRLIVTPEDGALTVKSGSSGVLYGTSAQTVSYGVSVASTAKEGTHNIIVSAVNASDGTLLQEAAYPIKVSVNQDSFSSSGLPAADVNYRIAEGDSLIAGKTNSLNISLFNRGNGTLRNARVTIELPEKMIIRSGSEKISIGNFASGDTENVSFPVLVDEDIENGSCKIVVNISGEHVSDGIASEKTISETIYVPVSGGRGETAVDLAIEDIVIPDKVNQGKDFTLSFSVVNNSSSAVEDICAEVTIPSGVANSSKNIFIIDKLEAGAAQSCSVTLKAQDGEDFRLFKITAGPADGGRGTVSQYAGTSVISSSGSSSSSDPILMLSAYDYGGQAVAAGEEFDLSVTLKNTNTSTSVNNIKVTVSPEPGTFLPVGTGNSFYIASVPAGGSYTYVMRLSCAKDAAQGPRTVTISSSYENADGDSFSASDVISVPVVQQVRLVIDDILDPGWLTADSQGYVSINYRNMGNYQINNLVISIEGDFSVDGNASYYAGNMAAGKSDYYSANFWPYGPGECNGRVVFAYEDGEGNEQQIVKEFTFNIGEGMVWEDPEDGDWEEPVPQGFRMPVWGWIAIAVVAVIVLVIVLKAVKKHKIKKQEALDLDD